MTRDQLPGAELPGCEYGTTVKALAVDGFRISEAVYAADGEIPPRPRGWADLAWNSPAVSSSRRRRR